MIKYLEKSFNRVSTLFVFSFFALYSNSQTTYNYTGASETYTVPVGITTILIECWGAQGGGDSLVGGPGGLGGYVSGELVVIPGQTYEIFVGGQGTIVTTAGGFNGGGNGTGTSGTNFGGSGGGASDVRFGGLTINDRNIVAGGGGGGAKNSSPGFGGDGGGLTGADGVITYNGWGCANFTVATGGTPSAGGLGGTSTCSWNGQDGAFGVGGNSYNNYACGGGGGGWYGGGGAHNGGTGAGGSSYLDVLFYNVVDTQGVRYGDGLVVITPLCGHSSSSITEIACNTYTAPSGIQFISSGIYSDTISNAVGCDSVITINLTVYPIDTTVSVSGVSITSNAVGATYQWHYCNVAFTPISGATSVSYTPSTTGNYAVLVTDNGCSDTSTCTLVSFVGIEESLQENNVVIYPNPSSTGNFVVYLKQFKNAEIFVYDLNGKLMTYDLVNDSSYDLSIEAVKGIYILEVRSDFGSVFKKLIVE